MRLLQPPLLDLTNGKNHGVIQLKTDTHRFAPDAALSGTDPINDPIFGAVSYNNGKLISDLDFGIGPIRFKRGSKAHVTFENNTGFSFNLHWHGLNTTGDIDGAVGRVEFGQDTQIGNTLDINFPKITNNSSLLFVHIHPMFRTAPLLMRGLFGFVDVVDEESKFMEKYFKYSDNRLMLAYQDLDLNSDGTLTDVGVYTDTGRSCFGMINGQSCVDWYSNDSDERETLSRIQNVTGSEEIRNITDRVKYVTNLKHTSTRNLMKVDILNTTTSFRTLYVGVCDKHDKAHCFYTIQTGSGLMNPTPLKMTAIAPANRASLMFDLNDFEDGIAHIFFYNFDLTEVFDIELSDHNTLIATAPDINQKNPTPNPTPIPDPHGINPQGNPNPLTYPPVSLIPQQSVELLNGNQFKPKHFTIKKFLKVKYDKSACHKNKTISQSKVIEKIRKVVFGDNYPKYKEIINKPLFEYDPLFNYVDLLNPKYFYNLPNFKTTAERNLLFIADDGENSNVPGGFASKNKANYTQSVNDPNGSTELVMDQNRVMIDLWNSDELDLDYAIQQYNLNPNNYQPSNLPTSLFTIFPSNPTYINTDMIANDTLTIQIFNTAIGYGDVAVPIGSVTIVFPSNDVPMNVNQLKALINTTFANTLVNISGTSVLLSTILSYDWTFYPFKFEHLRPETFYVKSLMMKTNNSSPYYVRFLGKWQLLQFFGKPMGTMTTTPIPDTMFPNNYNANIDYMYPAYATTDPNTQIITPDGQAQLIINPTSTYLGFIDGFQADSLQNFSVIKNSSEKWIYHNMDNQDTHPLHFHLTSGFVDVHDCNISKGLVSKKEDYLPYLYSRDIYGIPSQQTISFYLKFANYASDQGALNPKVLWASYVLHCHYLMHHDSGMEGSYVTFENQEQYDRFLK